MKLVIFGATGKTGKILVNQALNNGHYVIAYVRRENNDLQTHKNLKIIVGGLEDNNKLLEALTGADACISALGGNSITKHSTEFIAGFNKIVSLTQQVGIKRFIYLSSIGVGESRYYMGAIIRFLIVDLMLRVPLADHNINEKVLTQSNLKWTIIRPGSLTDGEITNNLKHSSDKIKLKGNPKISRANVAAFMLQTLEHNLYLNKGVSLFE